MAFSVEVLSGLERKLNISVPAEEIQKEVNDRLKKMATKVKIPGFRPGKVPMNLIKQRYYNAVYHEVIQSMIEPTFTNAINTEKLNVAGSPKIECDSIDIDKDFVYTALVEVFPEFEISELNQEPVEIVISELTDKDIDKMIDNLREQNMSWSDSDSPLKNGDKVVMDFEGFIDDVAFEGGKAKDYEIVLGSGSLIPGFEEALVGAKKGQTLDVNVTFPENYGKDELAGKPARFSVTVNKTMTGTLPEVNEEFVKKFDVKNGTVESFRQDIKENMARELARQLRVMNRETIFEHLMKKNEIELPNVLVDQEIEHLKHEMYHRVFGTEHHANEKIPDFPRELFDEQAKRRVHLGLLFSKYVQKHQLTVAKDRVDAMIDEMVGMYEKPDELRKWYRSNKESLAQIEAVVLEDMTAEKILEDAKVVNKSLDYDAVVNRNKN